VDIDVSAVVQQTRLGLSGMKKGGLLAAPNLFCRAVNFLRAPVSEWLRKTL
jgi:hypothetical protein